MFPIGRLLAASLICALSLAAHAQAASASDATPADGTAAELDRVTVIGSRVPRTLAELPMSISVLDETEIAEQFDISTNVLESLDVLVPGLTTSQEEFRSGCRTNIRGRPAQFLINGVPTNDNLRRSSCGSLHNLSPFAIERIEVLRGATALFGAGAPGGAIDLRTRRASSEQLEVDAVLQWSANPHETSRSSESNLYLGAGQTFADWDYYGGFAMQDYGVRRNPDGGVVPGETFGSWSAHTSIGGKVGEQGHLRFTGLHYQRDPYDIYGTDFTQVSGERLASSAFIAQPPNPYAGQAETEQTLLALSYEHADVLGHALSVSAYWHDETVIQRAAEFFAGSVFYSNTDAENQRRGLRTTLQREFAIGAGVLDLTYGLDWQRQRYYRPQVDPSQGGAVTGYISPEVILDSTAALVQAEYHLGNWRWSGGVRHERFDGEVGDKGFAPTVPRASTPGEVPDFDLTLFNVGAVYNLRPQLQLYGGFSQGAEISEFGRAARGVRNPALINLDGATSDQYELGLRGRAGDVDFSAAAFVSKSDKAALLQADPSCAGQPLCPLIPLRLEQKIHGAELTADWRAGERWGLGSLLTYQRGESNPPGVTPVPIGTDTLTPLRWTAYVDFQPLLQWRNRFQATWHADSDIYDASEEAQGFRDTDSYLLVDFTSSYPVGPGTLSLGLANLLNEKYVNVTNQSSGDFFYYLSEGRRATLTYRLRF
jgi:iron complex outermembrane receptor protein